MQRTSTDRVTPWSLAAGAGAAAGVLAGLSLARPIPLVLAAAMLILGVLGNRTTMTVTAGVACAVSAVLTLGAGLSLPLRLGLALAYGAAGAGVTFALRRYVAGRPLGLVAAAVVAVGMTVVPPVALLSEPYPFVADLAEPAILDVDGAQAYLAGEVRGGRLPALVFGVAERGEAVRYAAFGTTGPQGEPVRPETRFRIGSMSKSFTALAVMRLVEAGRIDLERPVVDYLDWFDPEYPPGRDAITVAELLHHSSGIPNSAGWEFLAGGADPVGDMKEALADTRLLDRGDVEYANANYMVAAQVIEAVTGEPFADYLTREVIAPLGLTATTPDRPVGDDLAQGHRLWFGVPVRSTAPFLDFAVPAGFITSNAVDLLSYLDQVVRADSPVVTRSIRERLLDGSVAAPHSPVGEPFADQRYAKGWVRGPIAGIDVVWHSGGIADFNSVMVSHPDGDWAFVVLISTASQISSLMPAITENLTAILHGAEPPRPRASTTLAITYMLVDLGLIGAGLLVAWATATLMNRRRYGPRPGVLAAIVGTSTTVLVGVMLGAPALTGFPAVALSLRDQVDLATVLTTYVPDVGWSLVTISAMCVVLTSTSIVLAARRRTSGGQEDEPHRPAHHPISRTDRPLKNPVP